MLRRLVGEGSLTAAVVPVFTGYLKEHTEEEVWQFAGTIFWTLALVLAAIAAIGAVFSSQVISVFTLLGNGTTHWDLAAYLNRIMFPYIFFIGLAALAMAILNSLNIFALPAAMPIVFNIALIIFSFAAVYRPVMKWAPPAYRSPAVALAVGVLVGGIAQVIILMRALAKRGMRFRRSISFRDPGVRMIARLMIPGFFGIGIYQINFFVDTIFATSTRLPQGTITSLYVANRIMELAMGSFAIAVSTAILPLMSRQAAAGEHGEMKRTFHFSLRLVSFITIPAAVGLALLREPIVQVLFQHGKFSASSTELTSRALLYYSLGLPGFAAVKLVVPLFYAIRDTATPVRIAAYAMLLNIGLNIVFLVFFSRVLFNGSPALATTIAAYFNFSLLFTLFRERFGLLGTRSLLRSLAKIATCACAMGLGCIALLNFNWARLDAAANFATRAGSLAAIIVVGLAIYLGLAWVFRCQELSEAAILFRRAEVVTS